MEHLGSKSIEEHGNPTDIFNPYKKYPNSRFGTDTGVILEDGTEVLTTKGVLKKHFPEFYKEHY